MPKLAKLTEDGVQKWLRDIGLAKEWKKPYEARWDLTLDYLAGRYFDELSDEDKICVNMVRPHVNVVIPAIYSKNPDVLVYPSRQEKYADELIRKRAELMRNLLRYLMKELDLKTEVKLCILDAIMTGIAWMKTCYEMDYTIDRPNASLFNNSVSKIKTVVREFINSMQGVDKDEPEPFKLNEKIENEKIWALRTSPYDIIVPALSRRPDALWWIAEQYMLPYEYVKEQSQWNTNDLEPSATAADILRKMNNNKYKNLKYAEDCEFNLIYEIWDNRNQCKIVLADEHPKPLYYDYSEYTYLNSKNHPYVNLRFNELIDEFYPDGDIVPALPQIEELNEIRTQQSTHRKRYNRKYLSKSGALEPAEQAKLKSVEDGVVIEVNNNFEDEPVESTVKALIDAPLPPEVYAVEARCKDDMFTILGTINYASRASGGARTATEAHLNATQSQFSVQERIDAIGVFVQKVMRNIAQISQKMLDSEQVGVILGDDGALYWVNVQDRKQIRGEFTYEIVYGSSVVPDKEIDRQQFNQFFAVARDDPYFDQAKLRLELVRKHGLINPESWLNPQLAEMLDMQRTIAVRKGMLLGTPQNALGSPQARGKGQGQTPPGTLPTGQPQGLPGDLSGVSVGPNDSNRGTRLY